MQLLGSVVRFRFSYSKEMVTTAVHGVARIVVCIWRNVDPVGWIRPQRWSFNFLERGNMKDIFSVLWS